MKMTEIKTLYISGKMSGLHNFNYDTFDEITSILRDAGYTVINPAENGDGDQSRTWHEYMRDDIGLILNEIDAVVVLQDWETSEGAKIEVAVARALGLPVWDVTQFAPGLTNNPPDDNSWARNHPAAPEKSADGSLKLVVDTSQASPILEDYGIPWPLPKPSILLEAEGLINGVRNRDYDHPLDNFERICALWSVILDTRVTPEQHALCMVALKIARLMYSPNHHDSIVDIAGYAGTYEKVLDEKARRGV